MRATDAALSTADHVAINEQLARILGLRDIRKAKNRNRNRRYCQDLHGVLSSTGHIWRHPSPAR